MFSYDRKAIINRMNDYHAVKSKYSTACGGGIPSNYKKYQTPEYIKQAVNAPTGQALNNQVNK
jgi:hypothetical protein